MFKYRALLVAGVLFFAAFLSASIVSSQDDNPPIWDQDGGAPTVKTVDGSVVSVDPQGSTITIKTVEMITFFVPSSASVTDKDGFSVQLSRINPGTYAMVEYYNDKSGRYIARSVNIEYAN